ncbi:MAG: tRNA pseudouridine(55) synthase TruB, partial [Gammaproteobacteria bacterium]
VEELKAMDEQRLLDQLINVDKPLEKMPPLHLNDQQAIRIQQGQALYVGHASMGKVRLYHASLFLGLGEMLMDGKLVPVKMFNLTG